MKVGDLVEFTVKRRAWLKGSQLGDIGIIVSIVGIDIMKAGDRIEVLSLGALTIHWDNRWKVL